VLASLAVSGQVDARTLVPSVPIALMAGLLAPVLGFVMSSLGRNTRLRRRARRFPSAAAAALRPDRVSPARMSGQGRDARTDGGNAARAHRHE
jgi:predicted lipid-binding transport protein (Tim44 family)